MFRVLAPVAGHSRRVDEVPDPVFARGLVGHGLAIQPFWRDQVALAPVDGRLVKVWPHAYVTQTDEGRGVLVHLGIDTVRMEGDGFEVRAREGDRVRAGDEVVAWNPSYVERVGHSSVCTVLVLDGDPEEILGELLDVDVAAGQPVFEVC